LDKFAKINAFSRQETANTRPMSDIHQDYGMGRGMPEGIAGSISASLALCNSLDVKAREERKCQKKSKKAESKTNLAIPNTTVNS